MHGQVSKIAILGFGREGQSLLAYLKNNPVYRGSEIWVLDRDVSLQTEDNRIHWQLGPSYLKDLSRFEIIFRSPGIPYTLSALYRARCDGTVVSSATNLFFKELSGLPKRRHPTVIGVTGTKGKGTTSTLVYEILRRAKRKTVIAGNIGKPVLDIFSEATRAEFVVLELSSFQLQDFLYAPDIAVVLDVFPDHLDQHKSLREYYGSKANIGRFQKKTGTIFFFDDNPLSARIAAKSPARKFPVTPEEKNLNKNRDMARAVANFLGIPKPIIEKTIKSFRGLEHRMEKVRTRGSITFWNDSAATNPEAAAAAVRTIQTPLILIAGGKDKNLDYQPLRDAIKESGNVRGVVLIGENRKKIRKAIRAATHVSIQESGDLKDAVKTATEIASAAGGEFAILFSPAAASFDMFRSYADRGEQFKRIVNSL